jgi:hypothetical protein
MSKRVSGPAYFSNIVEFFIEKVHSDCVLFYDIILIADSLIILDPT